MNWQKRECSIKMEITPYGDGWEDIDLEIQGDHHWWSVSGSLGDGFGALVESLYCLYPEHYREFDRCRWLKERAELTGERKNGKWVDVRPVKPGERCTYFTVPVQTRFLWDEEGCGVRWALSRPANDKHEFPLSVEIEEFSDYGARAKVTGRYRYVVPYADMCHAVGKALTAAMKTHGFTGFEASVWESDINVRHLCFLKACGMGRPDFFMPVYGEEQGSGAKTSFADEMELLAFDM